ncbi:MAG TPA: tRNA pseudouridine(55) synthase TruB [Pyrinomonadaceae bacterium]|jgi:tRNA pseudouridine55 synthase|nr:tRNA pseudouridine(55) synthase TruB [Pyrinomonadaceae bacterium]
MVNGVLVIDKPAGLTSHDVVARVRRSLRERRVGHTGTLDPFATGVLVLLLGRATRLAQFLARVDKEYEALIRFGYATETGDATGAPRRGPAGADGPMVGSTRSFSDGEIEAALRALRGEIEQVPPMYSAKKLKGKKLYELARRGLEVERQAVRVKIHELEAVPHKGGALLLENEDGTRDLSVRVVCSAGTYVRTLAESVGERLGVGAHLAALRRTRAGDFRIQAAVALDELEEWARGGGGLEKMVLSTNAALLRMPSAHLTGEEARAVRHGVAVRAPAGKEAQYVDGEPVRAIDEQGNLLAVAIYEAETGHLRPRVVLAPEK